MLSYTIHQLDENCVLDIDAALFTTRLAHKTTIDPNNNAAMLEALEAYAYSIEMGVPSGSN